MTLAEAKKILSGKLTFGDPDQIKAVRFIGNVEEAKEAYQKCLNHASSKKEFWDFCYCVDKFSDEVKNAARLSLRGKRK